MVKTVRQYNTGLTGNSMLNTPCANNVVNHTNSLSRHLVNVIDKKIHIVEM